MSSRCELLLLFGSQRMKGSSHTQQQRLVLEQCWAGRGITVGHMNVFINCNTQYVMHSVHSQQGRHSVGMGCGLRCLEHPVHCLALLADGLCAEDKFSCRTGCFLKKQWGLDLTYWDPASTVCFGCRDAMLELGLACDGGKDSLSMAAAAGGETVMAPGNLVVSAYVGCPDITQVSTISS